MNDLLIGALIGVAPGLVAQVVPLWQERDRRKYDSAQISATEKRRAFREFIQAAQEVEAYLVEAAAAAASRAALNYDRPPPQLLPQLSASTSAAMLEASEPVAEEIQKLHGDLLDAVESLLEARGSVVDPQRFSHEIRDVLKSLRRELER